MSNLYFQYCQKLMVFDEGFQKVFLAKRKGEQDYDGIYSFIGGKMETTDGGFTESMSREKTEEIGAKANVSVVPVPVYHALFSKKDGSSMILPHYIGMYNGGAIEINDEYSDYQWVDISGLSDFGPKIDTIEPAVTTALKYVKFFHKDDFVSI